MKVMLESEENKGVSAVLLVFVCLKKYQGSV
jgi:hypothetical protein